MKIGIDARMLGPKQGGLGRYIQQLIQEIIKVAKHQTSDVEFVIFLRKENFNSVPETPNVKKVLADIPWYGWAEQIKLPKIIKREKIDLMHFPHWNIPIFYNQPFVVTIHDLLLLHYPTRKASTLGPITYFFKNIAYRITLKHAIKKSKHIITPSEFTKKDILKHFNIPTDKITAIHLGISSFKFPRPTRPTDSSGRAERHQSFGRAVSNFSISEKYKINKPYILYVGVAYPHKNLDKLTKAWKIFCEKHGNDYHLALVGRKNYFYEKIEKISASEKIPNITFTDFVPDEELPTLYKNASLYVFPSLYEGFGLPPLEAMIYGTPVISSDRSCLPEILKDAAFYFNPDNLEQISGAIYRGLTDIPLRGRLIAAGEQILKNYSWNTATSRTLEIYRNNV